MAFDLNNSTSFSPFPDIQTHHHLQSSRPPDQSSLAFRSALRCSCVFGKCILILLHHTHSSSTGSGPKASEIGVDLCSSVQGWEASQEEDSTQRRASGPASAACTTNRTSPSPRASPLPLGLPRSSTYPSPLLAGLRCGTASDCYHCPSRPTRAQPTAQSPNQRRGTLFPVHFRAPERLAPLSYISHTHDSSS